MDDLTQWLRTQLDEDAVRAAQWHHLTCELLAKRKSGLCDCGGAVRVLREIDADRKLLAQFVEAGAREVSLDDAVEYADGRVNALGLAVRLRASVYSDRAGYREEWKP